MTSKLYSGQRFRRAVRAFVVGRASQAVANFILTLWIVRLFALEDYGAYMVLWGLIEMLSPLSSMGLLEAVRRYLPDLATRGSPVAVREFVRWTTLARLLILLIWVTVIALLWHEITSWLGFKTEQAVQSWVAVILVVTVLGMRYACEMLEGLLEQRWSQLVLALMPLGRLMGISFLVLQEAVDLGYVLWVDAAVSFLCFLIAELILARRLRTLPAEGTHGVVWREVAGFAWNMAGVNLLQAMAGPGALRLIVTRMLGLEVAGLYAFLQQLLSIVARYMPAQLLAGIVRPMFVSRLALGENDIVASGLGMLWKSNVLIVLAGCSLLLSAGDGLVDLASGGRFPDAGAYLLLALLGLGATSQTQVINMAMQIHDRTRALRAQSLLFLLVPLAAWLGAIWELAGALGGIVFAQWMRNGHAHWWMRRNGVVYHHDLRGVIRFGFVCILAAGLGLLVAAETNVGFALTVILLVLSLGAWLVKPLSIDEGQVLGRLLKGKAGLLRPFIRRG